ncbi:MAG: aminotransferase class I/II-fold pyridoxal phosphate-dependent enzyme [Spirochaetaceae bacterium]|nr:aminotransferase class I/II-fold pyridoxal phosphate-dependent enzyme [Spirochaetaceae bacterium]
MEKTDVGKQKLLKLDANEGICNLDGVQLARVLSPEVACRYPRRKALENDLADYFGITPSQIVATAGADDAIDRAFRSLAGPGSRIATTTPGFVEFLEASRRTAAEFLPIQRKPGDAFPLDEFCSLIAREKPAIAVIASPDNPGGTALSKDEFLAIAAACAQAGSVFLFDVTYADFVDGDSLIPLALETKDVLLTGSFSKSRGLAGFRAGWAMTGADSRSCSLIEALKKAGPPFSLSSPAIEAARIALAEGGDRFRLFVAEIKEERAELFGVLSAMRARTWPSQAYFVSALLPDAGSFVQAMKQKGILVRCWPDNPETKNLVRITCPGEPEAFERLLVALQSMEAFSWQ